MDIHFSDTGSFKIQADKAVAKTNFVSETFGIYFFFYII